MRKRKTAHLHLYSDATIHTDLWATGDRKDARENLKSDYSFGFSPKSEVSGDARNIAHYIGILVELARDFRYTHIQVRNDLTLPNTLGPNSSLHLIVPHPTAITGMSSPGLVEIVQPPKQSEK